MQSFIFKSSELKYLITHISKFHVYNIHKEVQVNIILCQTFSDAWNQVFI